MPTVTSLKPAAAPAPPLADDYSFRLCAQLARWRTADHLVVMAPAGLLRPREVPSGWGLVEVDSRALKKGWEPVAGALPSGSNWMRTSSPRRRTTLAVTGPKVSRRT